MNNPERKSESTFEEAVRQQRIRCGEFDVPAKEVDQVFEVAEAILRASLKKEGESK